MAAIARPSTPQALPNGALSSCRTEEPRIERPIRVFGTSAATSSSARRDFDVNEIGLETGRILLAQRRQDYKAVKAAGSGHILGGSVDSPSQSTAFSLPFLLLQLPASLHHALIHPPSRRHRWRPSMCIWPKLWPHGLLMVLDKQWHSFQGHHWYDHHQQRDDYLDDVSTSTAVRSSGGGLTLAVQRWSP